MGGGGEPWRPSSRRSPYEGTAGTRASSAKTRGFHTQLDEGPETPCSLGQRVRLKTPEEVAGVWMALQAWSWPPADPGASDI